MGIKDISESFDTFSEEDVRVAVTAYFFELGYHLADMKFEDSFEFQLGHTSIRTQKPADRTAVRGRSDMLLVHDNHPLAIVETKAPDEQLTDRDRDQALSYGRLLRDMPPYTIVTNGRETRVYDTVTADKVVCESAKDSVWYKNGGHYNQGADKTWAARTLLNLNLEVLRQFCANQVNRNMAALRGTPHDHRRYAPDLYVSRESTRGIFSNFLSSSSLSLAIVGESGTGKTNEMCVLAETLNQSSGPLALFYRAVDLANGLRDSIRSDFEWEFEREEPVARIVDRFAELALAHQTKLVIFLEGLDEYPSQQGILKAELVGFVGHLDPAIVRLCLSCKLLDWPSFVQERGEGLNTLGQSVYQAGSHGSELPGIRLMPLEEAELDLAWVRYSTAYHVPGTLAGETRQACKMPIMLRLVSQVYGQVQQEVPSDLSEKRILDKFWEYALSDFTGAGQRLAVQQILVTAAEEMLRLDRPELSDIDLFKLLDPSERAIYDQVLRHGLLIAHTQPDGSTLLAFPFETLRPYTYTVISRRWYQAQNNIDALAREVSQAISTWLGREALSFFLTSIDTELGSWLTPLIKRDLVLFLRANREFASQNRPIPIAIENSYAGRVNCLRKFIAAYSPLRDQFPNLKRLLQPRTEGSAGLWVSGYSFGFRTVNQTYPNLLVELSQDDYLQLIRQLYEDKLDAKFSSLQPAGDRHEDYREHVYCNLPAISALTYLNKQISYLLSQRQLNESTCPMILSEKVYEAIRFRPNWSYGKGISYFWERLGYSSVEDALSAPCADLIVRVAQLAQNWQDLLQGPTLDDHQRHWYEMVLPTLLILGWHLRQLSTHSDHLLSLPPDPEAILSYLGSGSLQEAADIALRLAPNVVTGYRQIVEANFPYLISEFATYKASTSRLLIELFKDSHSDYMQAAYIWLPSAPPGQTSVRVVTREQSLAEQFITDHRSAGNIHAKNIALETRLDGALIAEKQAVISRVRFPDAHHPVSTQIYQLVANEVQEVLGFDFTCRHIGLGAVGINPALNLRIFVDEHDIGIPL